MRVTVIGAGYVGLVTAACLAELGNRVTGVDKDFGRIALLKAGGVPIHEPGLDELIGRNLRSGRLSFTTHLNMAINSAEVVIIAVGTPSAADGRADLRHVLGVAREIGRHMTGFRVVVNKSTVPVGTALEVSAVLRQALDQRGMASQEFAVVSNPEFLKEGAAIEDFMRPDRIVIGLPSSPSGERARQVMSRLYAPFNRHHERMVWMDTASAELTKYAANAMLATRISFMNEMANLADRVDADIDAVRRGIGADHRIGHSFLYAGTGYGGSCFPKDMLALLHTAESVGLDMRVVAATNHVNHDQKQRLCAHVTEMFGQDLHGRRFAIWGLAFKPNTDDMREAPSRTVTANLLHRGAELVAYDPMAMDEARRAIACDLGRPPNDLGKLRFADDPLEALTGADALLILTEWKCFQTPDFHAMHERMRQPVILDGRNLYDPNLLEELGFLYQGIGRRNAWASRRLGNGAVEHTLHSPSQTA